MTQIIDVKVPRLDYFALNLDELLMLALDNSKYSQRVFFTLLLLSVFKEKSTSCGFSQYY